MSDTAQKKPDNADLVWVEHLGRYVTMLEYFNPPRMPKEHKNKLSEYHALMDDMRLIR